MSKKEAFLKTSSYKEAIAFEKEHQYRTLEDPEATAHMRALFLQQFDEQTRKAAEEGFELEFFDEPALFKSSP